MHEKLTTLYERISLEEAERRGERYYYDEDEAEEVTLFFRSLLRHSKGQFAGKPFELLPWQVAYIQTLFGWRRVDNRRRRFRTTYLSTAKKNGKALALDTPILTVAGWKTIGTVSVGDFVFHPDGRPIPIMAKSEVFTDIPCYEVAFSKLEETVVAAETHLWETNDLYRGVQVRTTKEIAESLKWSGGNRHSVRVCDPVVFPEADLPVDPYVLGVWLGDGHSASARVTVGKRDLAETVGELSGIVGISEKHYKAGSATIRLGDGTQSKLRKLGLLGCKHIPGLYAMASVRQREALLQGLMDTDGTISKAGQCELTLCNERLARDAFQLICTLGYKPSITESDAKLAGKAVGRRFRIQFTPTVPSVVFRLTRKQSRVKQPVDRSPRSRTRHICGCDLVQTVPTQCIQVGSPDGMFLVGRSMIPTHNSTLLAGIALLLTKADGEQGAEIYSVASDVNQASLVYREASLMVKASPYLSDLEVSDSRRNISDIESSSFYRVLPGDGFRVEGINAHGILFDELHAQRDRRLFDALKYAGAAREQPLFIAATTAGFDTSSICYEMYEYAKNVIADPDFDPTFLPFICEPEDPDDWKSEEAWRASNPSYGVTVGVDAFEADFREAETSLVKENSFRRYRVNQWVQQENRFINMDHWRECSGDPPEPLAGRPCWVGLDLASTWDISAMVAVFPDADGCYDVLCRFWIPGDNVPEREVKDRVPYSAWLRESATGLTTTPGNVTDYDFIRRDINEFGKKYAVKKLLIDRWNATQLSIQLGSDGFDVLGFGQGFAQMSAPTKHLENLVVSRKLRHGGNKVLTSMASAVSVKSDPSGNIRPVKPESGVRIDGIVALIMAIGGHTAEEIKASATPEIFVL